MLSLIVFSFLLYLAVDVPIVTCGLDFVTVFFSDFSSLSSSSLSFSSYKMITGNLKKCNLFILSVTVCVITRSISVCT